MIPSDALIISSILSTPSLFSILEIIDICSALFSSSIRLIDKTSLAFLIKEAAIKSTSCFIPNLMSSISFCVNAGS